MKPTVLFSVLNWGLGHASRSIPIINSLLKLSYNPILCSDGLALELLRKEFPNLDCEELPSYNIRYKYKSIGSNILRHLPDIIKAIGQEHEKINLLQKKYNAVATISDNRYGCYLENVPSAIITHQLNLNSKPKWKGTFASKVISRYIQRFDECWIPDESGHHSLSGELSNNHLGNKVKRIGCLSRFKPLNLPIKYDLVAVLSGPEPQRTRFEELVLNQLSTMDIKSVLVRGTTKERNSNLALSRIDIHDLLKGDALNELLCSAKYILCRSGYSSLMDLQRIGKKAILVPTPGQTEQEYLAKHLKEKKYFYSIAQEEFELSRALDQMDQYSGITYPFSKQPSLANHITPFLKKS